MKYIRHCKNKKEKPDRMFGFFIAEIKMEILSNEIIGERIYLKRHDKTLKHAEEMLELIRNSIPELQPWLSWASAEYSLEQAYEYMVYSDDLWYEKSGYIYAICLKDGRCIGNISIQNISENNKRGEFGYWMSTPYSGQGYMQEAVELLEKEAFAKGFHKMIIRTDVRNLKSTNVAVKRGYNLDGIMRSDMYSEREQRYRDINIFSKINPA